MFYYMKELQFNNLTTTHLLLDQWEKFLLSIFYSIKINICWFSVDMKEGFFISFALSLHIKLTLNCIKKCTVLFILLQFLMF